MSISSHFTVRRVCAFTLLFASVACYDYSTSSQPAAAAPVASLEIPTSSPNLTVGTTIQLTATVRDAGGNALVGRVIAWSTNNIQVATVSATGLLTVVGAGPVIVTATSEGKSTLVGFVCAPLAVVDYDLVYEQRLSAITSAIRLLRLPDGALSSLLTNVANDSSYITDLIPSPDGTRLAFTFAQGRSGGRPALSDIYTANRDGSNVQQLTFSFEDDQPSWSPTGAFIAFRSRRANGTGDIWRMNVDGTNQTDITPDPFPAASEEQTPTWAPDGIHIVFSSDLDAFPRTRLVIMRADGAERRVLTGVTLPRDDDVEPSFSPDGLFIAFRRTSETPSDPDIAVVTVASGAIRRVLSAGAQTSPAWSPDNRRIAFASAVGGAKSQVFSMSTDGTDVARHSNSTSEDRAPRWIRRP